MRARFLSFFYLFPGLSLPLTDLLFIPFLRPQRRSLQAPTHLVQDSPYVTRVIAHSRYTTDELCNTRQGPQICCVSMSGSPTEQFLLDQRQLFLL
jgi:hypothetical protein